MTKKGLDPDKLKVWRTSAIVEDHKKLPETGVTVPSEASIEIAKEFVDENQK